MKTQIIIHDDIVKRLVKEYVENKCYEAFELNYKNKNDAFVCENEAELIVPSGGLIFSLKPKEEINIPGFEGTREDLAKINIK